MIQKPRILLVIPEVLFIPNHSDPWVFSIRQAGLRSECLAFLASDLYLSGVDVHVVQPAYKQVFAESRGDYATGYCSDLPVARVHMAQDRIFYYSSEPGDNSQFDDVRVSIAFQREVLHQWISRLQPDLVHCYDWMCGLIPAACKKMQIPSVFGLIEQNNQLVPLWLIEDFGIDAADFWDRLYYSQMPQSYEDTRRTNSVNLMLSGIWSATCLNVMSSWAIMELAAGICTGAGDPLHKIMRQKFHNQSIATIYEKNLSTENYMALYESVLKRPILGASSAPLAEINLTRSPIHSQNKNVTKPMIVPRKRAYKERRKIAEAI